MGEPGQDDRTLGGEDPRIMRWRRRRASAGWMMALGFGMLFGGVTVGALVGLQALLLVGAVLFTLYGAAAWSYWGYRMHRIADPWRWDPDLDGPVARIMEGRSFASPHPRWDPARRIRLLLGLAAVLVALFSLLRLVRAWPTSAEAGGPGPALLGWGFAFVGCGAAGLWATLTAAGGNR